MRLRLRTKLLLAGLWTLLLLALPVFGILSKGEFAQRTVSAQLDQRDRNGAGSGEASGNAGDNALNKRDRNGAGSGEASGNAGDNALNERRDERARIAEEARTNAGGDGGQGGEEEESCEDAGSLAWLMCPLIELIDGTLNWLDTQIQRLLQVDRNYYDNPGIRGAFNSIRNIAYVILVPIVLVMVIGTALNFDFISAYTVKRALPRLVIATIFIALSYQISVFLIELTNALGRATLGIITAPFSESLGDVNGISLASLFDGDIVTFFIQGAAIPVVIFLLIWNLSALLLGLIAGFLVLMLRQMFIVVLMLAAPLAILAWIFPGNDKLWKLWWGTFSKLLLMFPLIMAILAVGRIFAFTIHEAGGAGLDGAIMQPLMTLIAYLLPYAFIPFTFKFAGGLFATVSGMVNDRSKGFNDRFKNLRNKGTKAAFGAAGRAVKQGNLPGLSRAPEGTLRRRFGDRTTRLANAGGGGALNTAMSVLPGITRKGRDRRRQYRDRRTAGIDRAVKLNDRKNMGEVLEDENFDDWRQNGALAYAAARSHDEESLRAEARAILQRDATEEEIRSVEMTRSKYGNAALRLASVHAVAKDQTVTSQDSGMAGTTQQSIWKLAEQVNNDLGGGHQHHLAGTLRGEMPARPEEGAVSFGQALNLMTSNIANDEVRRTQVAHAYRNKGIGAFLGPDVKTYSVDALTEHLESELNTAVEHNDGEQAVQLLAQVNSLHEYLRATNPDKADVVQTLLQSEIDLRTVGAGAGGAPVAPPQGSRSVAEVLQDRSGTVPVGGRLRIIDARDRARNNAREWDNWVKEFQTVAERAQAQQAAAAQAAPTPGVPQPPGTPPLFNQSDRRLKKDIAHLYTTDNGIKIYSFRYFWDEQMYVGVMAQDLIKTHPHALRQDKYGFYLVDYSQLGVEMLTLEEWDRQKYVPTERHL